jgi:hypothetical protein
MMHDAQSHEMADQVRTIRKAWGICWQANQFTWRVVAPLGKSSMCLVVGLLGNDGVLLRIV